MNQKAFKKQLSIISSKDDSATASLLGFAIANRVEPNSASSAQPDTSSKNAKDDGSSHQRKEDRDGKNAASEKDSKAKKPKNANPNTR